MSHHTVRTQEVGAVEAPGHGAGLSGLAAGTEGSVQLGVVNPGDSVVREEPGHACRTELAVRVTAGTRDLLWVLLQHKTLSVWCVFKIFLWRINLSSNNTDVLLSDGEI